MKIQTGLRIDCEMRRKLAKLAEKDKRSLNNYIEHVLQKHLDEVEKEKGS